MTGAPTALFSAASGPEPAPLIVLIHGSLDRSAGLLKLSRRLDDRFRVIRYDRRGYGRSMPHPGPFGIEQQVSDLIDVIDHHAHGAGPCHVFGHSYGGNVALAAAQRHPDRVGAVSVYESPLSWLDWWPGATAGHDARTWAHDPRRASERFMRRLIGDARWEHLPESTRQARRDEGPALVGELIDLAEFPPWIPESVPVAVLAMHGARALDHHRLAAQQIAAWFASEPVEIPDARHFGPNTHPDAVAAAIRRFADSVLS